MRVKANCRLNTVACVAVALLLGACASGARTGAMTVPVSGDTLISATSPAYNAIDIGSVTGGSETSPLWKSKVSSENFRDALQQSLELHAMAGMGHGRYVLNAELLDLDQPTIAFNSTVTATVHYTLIANQDQSTKFDETIKTPYTASFSDAFVGTERLRLANEGAIRENIEALMKKLIGVLQGG